jgi:hypothetical protein
MSLLVHGVASLMGQVCMQCRTARETETSTSVLNTLIRLVGGAVQLGPLGMAATDWPDCTCPG